MEQETHQEEVAKEAEIQDDDTGEKETGKRRGDVVFELALIFILGFLLGVTIKTEAAKRVTIGFNDYKIVQQKQGFDFAAIKNAAEEAAKAAQDEADKAQQQGAQNVQQNSGDQTGQ